MVRVGRKLLVVVVLAMPLGQPRRSAAQPAPLSAEEREEVSAELRELRREVYALRRARDPVPPELTERERELRELLSGRDRSGDADDAAIREEYEAIRRDIRDLRAAGMEVPPDLEDRQRELREALSGRRRGTDRKRPTNRRVDPALREEYDAVRRDIRDLRAAGMEVPPDLTDLERELREQIRGRSGRSGRNIDPDLLEAREAIQRDMADLRKAGSPIPPDMLAEYAELQREISRQQRTSRSSARRGSSSGAERELEGLRRHIEALESRGQPVPESFLQRLADLEQEAERAGSTRNPRSPRTSRARLERDFESIVRQIERLEAAGKEVPESLTRKAETLDEQLALSDVEESSVEKMPQPVTESPLGDRGRLAQAAVPRDRNQGADPEQELARLDGILERFEAAGRPVPENLLARRERLVQQLEGAAPEARVEEPPEPAMPVEPRQAEAPPAVETTIRSREEARLAEMRDRIAAVEGQGLPVDKKAYEDVADLERRLTGTPPLDKSAPSTPESAAATEEKRQALAKLEKMQNVIRVYEQIGEPVPERLRRAADALETRLAATAAGTGRRDPKGTPTRANPWREKVVKLEAKLQGVEESIAQLREAGKEVPPKMTATAAMLRKQLEQARRRAGRAAPGGAKKSYANAKTVPYKEWGAYVDDIAGRFGFDEMQRAAALQILRECQDRIKPRIEANRGSGATAGTLRPDDRLLAEALFAELKRRVEYLITPGQRAEAKSKTQGRIAGPPAPPRKPNQLGGLKGRREAPHN